MSTKKLTDSQSVKKPTDSLSTKKLTDSLSVKKLALTAEVDQYLSTAATSKTVTPLDVRNLPKSTEFKESPKVKILGHYVNSGKSTVLIPLVASNLNVLYFKVIVVDGYKSVGLFNGDFSLFTDCRNKTSTLAALSSHFKPVLIALKKPTVTWIKSGTGLVTYDPEVYLKAFRLFDTDNSALVKSLEEQFTLASQAYHSGESESKLTDSEFDTLKELILGLDPGNKTVRKVGVPKVSKEGKVPLKHLMGSLEKVKFGESGAQNINTWIKKIKATSLVESYKVDGSSCQLLYKKGILTDAFTRGDGTSGQRITNHVKFVKNVPHKLRDAIDLDVRAEIIISKSTFAKKYKGKEVEGKEYKNGRNMVAGLLNRASPTPSFLKDFNCISFSLFDRDDLDKSKQLELLKKQGFDVVPYELVNVTKDAEQRLAGKINHIKANYDFEADGVVVEVDDANLRKKLSNETNSNNPAFARAFKLDDEYVPTTIRQINVEVSKDSILVPTATTDPIEIDGVTVSGPTLYNFKYIRENMINVGSTVGCIRSGGVIPKIVAFIKPSKTYFMPDPEVVGEYEWDENKVNLVLVDKNSEDAQLKLLEHFFTTIGVQSFGLGQIRKMYNAGYKTILSIVKAKASDMVKIQGFEKTSSENILKNIQKALNPVKLPVLMAASSSFGRAFGLERCSWLYDKFGEGVLTLNKSRKDLAAEVGQIKGLTFETGLSFAGSLPTFKHFYEDLKPYLTLDRPATGGKFSGKTFVFTGIRDKELEKKIEKTGGKIGSSFTAATTHLIVKDESFVSDKTKKALATGVTVLPIDQAYKMFS